MRHSSPADGIGALAAAVRRGELKAERVVEDFLARAVGRSEQLGTFIEITSETALARAREIDREVAKGGDPGPLAGVPIANKDLLFRGGGAMSAGSPLIRGEDYPGTATVLRRLEAAGAVDLGRLAMAEFALSPVGDNVHFEPARNPWDEDRVPGGSSSGSGAAVADRQVMAALGTDTAGSIRLPAAMCGVTGIKPTYGLVSRAGVFPLAPSLDSIGPLACSAADCALVLSVLAGPDRDDPTTSSAPAAHFDLLTERRPWRLAFARRVTEEACSPEVVDATLEAVRALRELGAEIVETDPSALAELAQLTVLILGVEGASTHRRRLQIPADQMGALVRQRIAMGESISGPTYVDALRLRAPLLATFLKAELSGFDALVLPTTPDVAPLAEEVFEVLATNRGVGLQELASRLAPVGSLTRPFNFLGLPALSMPVSTGEQRLPVGVQLVGRPFAERTILEIAAAYQSITDWHLRKPNGTT